MAMEVKEVREGSLSKKKLAQEVSELKKRLAEMGLASKGAQKACFTPGQNTKKDIKCYNCKKEGIWLEIAEGDISREIIPTQQQDRSAQRKLRARCCGLHDLVLRIRERKCLQHYSTWSNVCEPVDGEIRVTRELIVIPMGWWTHLEVIRNTKAN